MDIVLTGRHIQIKQKFRDVVESKMNRVTTIAPDAQRVRPRGTDRCGWFDRGSRRGVQPR